MRSVESTALRVLRGLEEEGEKNRAAAVTVKVASDVAIYMLNQKRRELARIETEYGMEITFEPKEGMLAGTFEIERTKSRDPGDRPRTIAVGIEAGFVRSDEPEPEYPEEANDEEVEERRRRDRRQRRGRRKRHRPSTVRRARARAAKADAAAAGAVGAAATAIAESVRPSRRRRQRPCPWKQPSTKARIVKKPHRRNSKANRMAMRRHWAKMANSAAAGGAAAAAVADANGALMATSFRKVMSARKLKG